MPHPVNCQTAGTKRRVEGVIFAFLRDGDVLVEHRPPGDSYAGMDVLPGGTLEPEDQAQPDPAEAALFREAEEELRCRPVDYERVSVFLCFDPFRRPVRTVRLYLFAVYQWDGQLPSHSQEGGRDFGRLHWWPLDRGGDLPHPCHQRMTRDLRARLAERA